MGIDYLEMEHYDGLVVGFAVKPRFRCKGRYSELARTSKH